MLTLSQSETMEVDLDIAFLALNILIFLLILYGRRMK